jgi:hypothetical protein
MCGLSAIIFNIWLEAEAGYFEGFGLRNRLL